VSKFFVFVPHVLFWPLIFLKLWLLAVRAQKMVIGQLIKKRNPGDPKWVLFRLKRCLLEVLLTTAMRT